jgi:transcriptional regulator with XRE-family HTH domain
MGIGSRLRQLRVEAHRTQRSIANGAGLAAEYLSRLENGRVAPTTRTLLKIAESLKVPVSALFDGEVRLDAGDRCPVSASGRCILDHLHAGRGLDRAMAFNRYSREQLESLRMCDFLMHNGSRDAQRTLATVLKSLFALSEADRKRRDEAGVKGRVG